MKLWTAVLASMLVFASVDADAARRLGGGSSIGRQSGNVTQRDAARPAQQQPPANNTATQQQPGQPAQAAQARPGTPAAAPQAAGSRWGGMLGGLAAGLGLAWLAHALGFGPELAQFLMFALIALVVMAVIGFVMRKRAGGAAGGRPMAYQGASPADFATSPRQYSPDKVGNDSSARPWERGVTPFENTKYIGGGVQIGSGLAGSQNWGIPAGFDVQGFVEAAKRNFLTLQDAWDRSDIPNLRSMMTDEMLSEIRHQLAEREKHMDGQPNKTDVVLLEAQLLGIEDLGDGYMASVEFSGMIREEPSAGPSPFREVWNMTKPKSGNSGWLVAGVQALQ
ncbi:Tim44 domain-containing protein [Ramlibacter henchirensis]|uniref:Tim44 domain-containing protein n=2 Tax=Ramlibacter henchirensis TaxID=204072 RepID=A0A4Z0BX27_9BURK|nr:Tim44 domain-containing protein [Ramlibacter henchirensis]